MVGGVIACLHTLNPATGFIPCVSHDQEMRAHGRATRTTIGATAMEESSNCGCEIQYSGKPSDKAKSANPMDLLRNSNSEIYSILGDKVRLNSLLQEYPVNILVFLRSFG